MNSGSQYEFKLTRTEIDMVTKCADVCVHKLDQWRSSSSSTDISITIFNFKEEKETLLTHALHRAPSASSETWSGGCSFLFERAASRRDCLLNASAVINYDIAREDAVRFRHLRAAHGCALLRDALSGACLWDESGHGPMFLAQCDSRKSYGYAHSMDRCCLAG